jgi:outer membrane lipoprotein SlyB
MARMKLSNLILIIFLCFLVSCASKPVLYPNDKLKAVGKEQAQRDIEQCMNESEEYIESGKGKKIARSAGKGAIFGAAVGAVSGALFGGIGRSAVGGAAIGATAGGVGEGLSPDEIKRQYVDQCLAQKNYHVLGWD